jgi:hypothetical protein
MRYWQWWRKVLLNLYPVFSEKWKERIGDYLYPDDCVIELPQAEKGE